MNIYSGFFMDDGSHVTWEFAPGKCNLPDSLSDGDNVSVRIIGRYEDDDTTADIVEVLHADKVFAVQANGETVLHVTRRTEEGVSPVVSGARATELGWTPIPDSECREIPARAGFFSA